MRFAAHCGRRSHGDAVPFDGRFGQSAIVEREGAINHGNVTTVVGTGVAGFSASGPAGAGTRIAEPFGVALGPDGWLYFCDLGNHCIRRVSPSGDRIETVAGTGRKGYAGDHGPAVEAQIDEPYEIRFDAAGNLVFVDMTAHVVRRIEAGTGTIATVAGTGEAGFGGDGGPALEARLRQPHSIEIAVDGAILVADIGNHRVRRIDAVTGLIDTFAGTGEQAATPDGASLAGTPLNGPRSLAFPISGTKDQLFLTLREGNAVLRVDLPARTIHRVAGSGRFGYAGDGGDALDADLSGQKGISVVEDAVYIADTESHTVRCIDRRRGEIATVLGDGSSHDGPDGDPLACGLARPHGVFATTDGRLFVGDTDNHRVRLLR